MSKKINEVVVVSSTVKAISYEEDGKILGVSFHGGGRYTFSGVPKTIYEEFKRSSSKGKYFLKNIKGIYKVSKS